MKQQIRKSVFETNSSSSHSLTMGTGDLAAVPFSPSVLRRGEVALQVGEYGWEYRRYYTPIEKLNYLLTQVTGGKDIPTGEPEDNVRTLCESHERVAMLCRVVKEHTGCDVVVNPGSGYIDHDSEGVGMELFNNEDTLRRFIFDQTAYVETSNNNASAPWKISTDRDGKKELYYLAGIREVPDDYVEIKLKAIQEYSVIQGFSTSAGGAMGEQLHAELFKRLAATGIATHAHWTCVDTNNSFDHRDIAGHSASMLLASPPVLHVSGDFTADCDFREARSHRETRIEDIAFQVMVPVDVAAAIAALPRDGLLQYELAKVRQDVVYWTERLQESKTESEDGQPDDWAVKQLAENTSKLAKLEAKLPKPPRARKPAVKKVKSAAK